MTDNPHLAPRTIREWLDLIPFDRARREAIENYSDRVDTKKVSIPVSSAIVYAFSWEGSDQNFNYWYALYNSLVRMEQSVKLKQDHGASFGMGY